VSCLLCGDWHHSNQLSFVSGSKSYHALIKRKGAKAYIPPRKNAGLWEEGHLRNEAVLVMRKEGLTHWKCRPGIIGAHWPRWQCTGSSNSSGQNLA
jgi:hypothetical protein